ncbi:hypothetical protein SAMN05660845_1757 [Flavobacterium swingsii]|jgi:hypothetical protein|uniref:Lipoprotein n=1 Tax=Flavobacterium swingsii TaxID=498292 RepID=A0A1I0YGT3_9FLAO|nr:hypothetical protein [Flavobacterium swingsii]SFB12579.1 hypothetical protein SAMN05660845_1757 [Flavobacterium swingsii]
MKTIKKFFVITILSIFVISCSKPDDGAMGPTGTANVIYSDWATTTFTNVGEWKATIIAPKITEDIVNKGTVLVYMRGNSSNPVAVPLNYVNGSDYISIIYEIGQIYIYSMNDRSSYSFRYIIIPGGVSVSGKTTPSDFQKMSYSEVCKTLNIPE